MSHRPPKFNFAQLPVPCRVSLISDFEPTASGDYAPSMVFAVYGSSASPSTQQGDVPGQRQGSVPPQTASTLSASVHSHTSSVAPTEKGAKARDSFYDRRLSSSARSSGHRNPTPGLSASSSTNQDSGNGSRQSSLHDSIVSSSSGDKPMAGRFGEGWQSTPWGPSQSQPLSPETPTFDPFGHTTKEEWPPLSRGASQQANAPHGRMSRGPSLYDQHNHNEHLVRQSLQGLGITYSPQPDQLLLNGQMPSRIPQQTYGGYHQAEPPSTPATNGLGLIHAPIPTAFGNQSTITRRHEDMSGTDINRWREQQQQPFCSTTPASLAQSLLRSSTRLTHRLLPDVAPRQKTTVFIQRIEEGMTQEKLAAWASMYGKPRFAKICYNYRRLESLGDAGTTTRYQGHVTYETHEEALAFLQYLASQDIPAEFARDDWQSEYKSLEDSSSTNLYIVGLPITVTALDIHVLLGPYGKVKSLKLLEDDEGHRRGPVLARLESRVQADRAILGLTGTVYPGATERLQVRISDSDSQKAFKRQRYAALMDSEGSQLGSSDAGRPTPSVGGNDNMMMNTVAQLRRLRASHVSAIIKIDAELEAMAGEISTGQFTAHPYLSPVSPGTTTALPPDFGMNPCQGSEQQHNHLRSPHAFQSQGYGARAPGPHVTPPDSGSSFNTTLQTPISLDEGFFSNGYSGQQGYGQPATWSPTHRQQQQQQHEQRQNGGHSANSQGENETPRAAGRAQGALSCSRSTLELSAQQPQPAIIDWRHSLYPNASAKRHD